MPDVTDSCTAGPALRIAGVAHGKTFPAQAPQHTGCGLALATGYRGR